MTHTWLNHVHLVMLRRRVSHAGKVIVDLNIAKCVIFFKHSVCASQRCDLNVEWVDVLWHMADLHVFKSLLCFHGLSALLLRV